jgi:hypothetical protein
MRSPSCVCLSVSLCSGVPPSFLLSNAWTNLYETRYVYHGTWAHPNGVLHKSLPSVCVSVYPPINFWMPEPICMKLGMYNMAPELIQTAYIINPSHQSVCLCVCASPIVARQRLSKMCLSFRDYIMAKQRRSHGNEYVVFYAVFWYQIMHANSSYKNFLLQFVFQNICCFLLGYTLHWNVSVVKLILETDITFVKVLCVFGNHIIISQEFMWKYILNYLDNYSSSRKHHSASFSHTCFVRVSSYCPLKQVPSSRFLPLV